MLLDTLQTHLTALYETPGIPSVADFLVTDAAAARALGSTAAPSQREALLLREDDEHLSIALYIDRDVLAILSARDPYACLDHDNLNAFLLALEGISHFVYVVWNALHQRPVTQLELELQAEVDKFVTATLLLKQQGAIAHSEEFHAPFFEQVAYTETTGALAGQHYRAANHFAGKYCSALNRRHPAQHNQPSFLNELRRFYRLSQNDKIRVIEHSVV